MFVFIKKIFYIGSLFLSSLVSTTSLNCISMKNQECKVRPEIINVNSNEPVFYPLVLKQANLVVAVTISITISVTKSICKNVCFWCYKKFKC